MFVTETLQKNEGYTKWIGALCAMHDCPSTGQSWLLSIDYSDGEEKS